MSAEEHRHAPRITQAFMVRYRAPTGSRPSWLVAPLRDLSSGGARFLSEGAFDVGDELEIQLLLPLSREPVSLPARVAWVKSAPLGMVELGVTFNPGDVRVQQTIDAAVLRFLHKEHG
jgi:Tfp pilus assembly protein PilZ